MVKCEKLYINKLIDTENKKADLSANPPMIKSVVEYLNKKAFDKELIYFDEF